MYWIIQAAVNRWCGVYIVIMYGIYGGHYWLLGRTQRRKKEVDTLMPYIHGANNILIIKSLTVRSIRIRPGHTSYIAGGRGEIAYFLPA